MTVAHRPSASAARLYVLDVGAADERFVRWVLAASHEVVAAFATGRDGVVAVLFSGDRRRFDDWRAGL